MFRALLVLPLAIVAIGAPSASAATTHSQQASTQGIIMRDGGVCDPIRHMGC